jgi:hypothetical protein
VEEAVATTPVFERLEKLVVSDADSPTDLATNPAHMEGFGVPRSA